MSSPTALPNRFRGAVLRHELAEAVAARRPKRAVRAVLSVVAPARWPPSRATRGAVLDAAVAQGDGWAARVVLADTSDASRPGSPEALRRAAAADVRARELSGRPAEAEQTVARYLRGDLPRAAAVPNRGPADVATAARAAADALRSAGHERPIIVATFPGFHANPYATLMEQAYEANGIAAIPVGGLADIEAIVDGRADGRYEAVLHVNGPDRFLAAAPHDDEPAAMAEAERVVSVLDAWRDGGVALVSTIHNGPQLRDGRAAAEQAVAQAVVDRASLVHLLTASTPDVLEGWLDLRRAPCVHVPHPNYDQVLGPLGDRAAARRALDVAPDADDEVLVGLIGTLYARKGPLTLVEALGAVPDPLPDGRRVRLLLAGSLAANGEALIRAAFGDTRVVTRFGYVPDDALPELLAAIDVAVVPYGRYLNSGWLSLALTAGIPAIAPGRGTAAEVVRPEALRTFDPDAPGSLAEALAAAPSLATAEARAAARASVADLDAPTISARFVEALLAAVSGTVRT